MDCARCGCHNDEKNLTCIECGASLSVQCQECGTYIPKKSKYCSECGSRARFFSVDTDSRFGTPHSYTPRYLAEKILTSRSTLEGERKLVTVMFCDIVGSTGIAERI